MATFGEKLKELRKLKKVKQTDVAEYLGLTSRNYQDYEYGKVDPPTSKTIALADYFDVPVDYLLGRGVFEHWDEILKHKAEIVKQLNIALPESFQIVNFSDMPDSFFMGFLECLLDKVEFHEDRVKLFYKADISTDQADNPV